MNYLREINAFYDWLETNPLPYSAIVLWHALMHTSNRAGWVTEFAVAISTLSTKTGLKKDAIDRARLRLQQSGRINFRSRTGQQSAIYTIIPFENCVAKTDTNQEQTNCDGLSDANSAQTAHKPSANSAQTASITKLNETKLKKTKTSTDEKNPSVKVLIDYYHDSFVKKFGDKPVINGAKDGNLLKKLLADYQEDKIKSWLDAFFSSKDAFITGSSYSLGVFYSQINKFLADKAINKTVGGGKYAGIVHKNGQDV